jgi:hypothetical protein
MRNPLKRFLNAKRGMVQIVVGAVLALVVAIVLLMVAVEITANVAASMPAVTGTANTTITNITTAAYGGLQLGTVIPIVIAAAAIVSIIVGAFAFGYRRQ